MESAMGDLLTMSKNLESQEFAKIRFTPERMHTLDEFLSDIYVKQSPKPIDYQNRLDLVRVFNTMAQEIYGSSNSSLVVEGYGSFVMDMFNEKSDLDMSINFVNSTAVGRQKKISTLRKFIRKLYTIQRKGHITSVSLITARVPIIKLTDRGTGIECDLSVENRDGITKSHIIHAISAIDERFRKLCFLMKSWAQVHNINSSKDRTLNSLSIVSLVAFHLQTCNPPILPPFSALLKDGADPASVINVVKSYLNYGKNNKDSLAKLFINLFVKLASIEQLWMNGLCVSLFKGSWISKSLDHSYSIRIEDFTDLSQNVARAVGAEEFKKIYACIRTSLHYLVEFLNSTMQGKDSLGLLFRATFDSTPGVGGTSNGKDFLGLLFRATIDSTPGVGRTSKANHNSKNHRTVLDPLHSKKKRHLKEEGLAQSQAKKQARQGAKPQEVGGVQYVAGKTLLNPASFTPPPFHQPPLSIPRTHIAVHHHGYGPGIAPPRLEGPHFPTRQPQLFPPQTFQSVVQSHHHHAANAVTPSGNGAFRPHLPPESHHNPYGGPSGNGAFHQHLPPASHHNPYGGPSGNGAFRPHLPPASHHNPYGGPSGNRPFRPHLPPASHHNPYGGDHKFHTYRTH